MKKCCKFEIDTDEFDFLIFILFNQFSSFCQPSMTSTLCFDIWESLEVSHQNLWEGTVFFFKFAFYFLLFFSDHLSINIQRLSVNRSYLSPFLSSRFTLDVDQATYMSIVLRSTPVIHHPNLGIGNSSSWLATHHPNPAIHLPKNWNWESPNYPIKARIFLSFMSFPPFFTKMASFQDGKLWHKVWRTGPLNATSEANVIEADLSGCIGLCLPKLCAWHFLTDVVVNFFWTSNTDANTFSKVCYN